jgi:hypothetical protein
MGADKSLVLTLRVSRALDRRIERAAKRRRRTKSALLREVLESAFAPGAPADDPESEARRQSLLVSGSRSEREALRFIAASADVRGWR